MSALGSGAPERSWMDRLAHDLRGPLSPLRTAALLLRNERVDASKRGELLDVIERQSRRLAAMIEEMGDWVCAQQGHLVVRREDTRLAPLLDAVGQSAPGAAPEFRFAPGTDALDLQGDTARLGQLLRTLVAVRLVREDTTRVRIDIELATPTRVRARRRIACTGNAVEQAENLFDAPLRNPHDDGLGLGLLMARAIAEAHGGSLRMHALDADTIELVLELPLAGAPVENAPAA